MIWSADRPYSIRMISAREAIQCLVFTMVILTLDAILCSRMSIATPSPGLVLHMADIRVEIWCYYGYCTANGGRLLRNRSEEEGHDLSTIINNCMLSIFELFFKQVMGYSKTLCIFGNPYQNSLLRFVTSKWKIQPKINFTHL